VGRGWVGLEEEQIPFEGKAEEVEMEDDKEKGDSGQDMAEWENMN
jgi:hypothetical protein